MAEFNTGDRVKVSKPGAATLGKAGTVKTAAAYKVLLDGEKKTREYAETSLDPYVPPPPPPATLTIELTADKKGAKVKTKPEGTDQIGWARSSALVGGETEHGFDLAPDAVFEGTSAFPFVGAYPRKGGQSNGDWTARLQTLQASVPPPPPPPDPPTDPLPPPTPPSSGAPIIACELGGDSGSFTRFKQAGIGWYRTSDGGLGHIPAAKSAGMKVATVCINGSNDGSMGSINPSAYAQQTRALIIQYGLIRVEVLNEPYGNWFWRDHQNYDAYVRILKATFEATRGLGCQIVAAFDPHDSWDDQIKSRGALQYCDEGSCHPYGGTSKTAASAAGNRQMVLNAHAKSGKKVAITEVGWPTAVGQSSTGDSAQWTEAEQRDNIVGFCQFVQANPDKISMMSLFGSRDYGSNMHYGIMHEDGSAKPSFAAFAQYATD